MCYLIVVQQILLYLGSLQKALDGIPDRLKEVYRVDTSGRKILHSDSIYQECKLEILRQELKTDLIKLE